MERSQTLTDLRDDNPTEAQVTECDDSSGNDFLRERMKRFPAPFIESTPDNAQKIILWCLERDPTKRPTAQELLKVRCIPLLRLVRSELC